jgi:hypothetical protein
VEPEDVGSILLTYLDDVEGRLLFSVQEADANSITMRGAFAAEDGSQDPCSPTIGLPSADFSENPYFQVGPGKTELAVEGISLVIEDLLVSGDFAEDGTWFGGGRLAGVIDTRPLQGLVGDTADTAQDGVCALVSGFGVECVDCPSDGEPFCLVLDVHGLVGERVGDEGLIEVVETPEGCE